MKPRSWTSGRDDPGVRGGLTRGHFRGDLGGECKELRGGWG